MGAHKEYFADADGNKVSLRALVKAEPEWAVGMIKWYEEKYEELVKAEETICILYSALERIESDSRKRIESNRHRIYRLEHVNGIAKRTIGKG